MRSGYAAFSELVREPGASSEIVAHAQKREKPVTAIDAVDAEQNYRQHRAYPGRDERGVYERWLA